MCRDDWLVSHASLGGVDRALRGLSKRFPLANPLASGGAALRDHYAALEADFRAFFPSQAEYARSLATAE